MIQQQRILVSLDCLLDTRYGTAVRHFGSKLKDFDYETYYKRDHKRLWDVFGVGRKEWKKAWEKRSKATLVVSRPTNLLLEAQMIFSLAAIRGMTSPVHEKLHVFVNTWPYLLTADEKYEFEAQIKRFLPENCECKLLRVSNAKLTPTAIKENFDSIFLIDLVEWLSQHREALAKTKIPAVTINYPSWLNDDGDDLRELIKTEKTDPATALKRTLSEFFALEILDGELFSMPMDVKSNYLHP